MTTTTQKVVQSVLNLNDDYFEHIDLPLSAIEIEERKLEIADKNLIIERARQELEAQKELIEAKYNTKEVKKSMEPTLKELITGIRTIKAKVRAFINDEDKTVELVSVEDQFNFDTGCVITVRPMTVIEKIKFKQK